MSVLVTGGQGFAGTHLTRRLLAEGYTVTVLDIAPPPHDPTINYLWKSVHDIQPADIKGHDMVVHLQAQADVPMSFKSPRWTAHQNVAGTIALLEACRNQKLEKIIYAASGSEWGRPLYLPIDEKHPLTPCNPYAWSKAAAEQAFTAWAECYSLPVTILANGSVVGPGMRTEIFIYKWLSQIMCCDPVTLEGGSQTRDVTYISDIVDAWHLAIKAPRSKVCGEKFIVSRGEEHTVRSLLSMCIEACDESIEDYPVIYKGYRPGEKGQREHFTNEKARTILGYDPKVDAEQAIRLTLEWMNQ